MKKYKPTTPSRRHMTGINYREVLTASEPHKPLTRGMKRGVGRNGFGRITTNHKGGGHKRSYRLIDFKFNKFDVPAKIETVEYDPNRTSFISLVCYRDGERRYVISPKGAKVGDTFVVGSEVPVISGNRTQLSRIPVGTFVYNVELKPGAGAKLARSAGNYIQVVAHSEGKTSLKMPSSEIRKVVDTCFASLGEVSNGEHNLVTIGKAGRARWMGIRPTVRGTVKNPVDHPYGGGEGRQGRGTKRPKTAHGKVTGGRKTRTPKKYSNVHIVTRRKTKRNSK
jgi:large subunit ribosomal protein L2